jgi:imidazolonepropionase-like amidohydrolase
VPTLSGYYWMAGLSEEVIDPDGAEANPDMPPVLVELARRNMREGAASMRAARQAGVKIALGSDTSLAAGLEVQRIVFHGLTPAEALVAATATAAEALGLDEHVGTVTEGKLADLIIVDGDPLADPRLLSDPARIWLVLQLGLPVAGQLFANPALASELGDHLPGQPDRPAGPKPADMAGWIQASRGQERAPTR